MARAANPGGVREFILEGEANEPAPTVWLIGFIDSQLNAVLLDKQMRMGLNKRSEDSPASIEVNEFSKSRDLVKFGLKGWKNLKDANEVEIQPSFIPYFVAGVGSERQGLSADSLDRIKPYLMRLAVEIEKDNSFTRNDEKNSVTPSR